LSIDVILWVALIWAIFAVYIYLLFVRKMRIREFIAVFLMCIGGSLIIDMGRSAGGNIGIALFGCGVLLRIVDMILPSKR
jgi:hypothetical protein